VAELPLITVDKVTLSDAQWKAFSALFNEVVWYSPYPDELKVIRSCQSGGQIREPVRETRRMLGVPR